MIILLCYGINVQNIFLDRAKSLLKDAIFTNLVFLEFSICIDCVNSTLTIEVRNNKIGRCGYVLELILIDAFWPITPLVLGGYRYFITFIDDFSHYGYVELIHENSNSSVAFTECKVNIELQMNKNLKAVQSDIGGEYYGRDDDTGWNLEPYTKYLQDCGIDAQYTMLGTPQQNGIAERRNHSLLDMVQFILVNSCQISCE